MSKPDRTEGLLNGLLYTPNLHQLNDPFESMFDVVDEELIKHFARNYGTVTPDKIFKSLSSDEKVDIALLSALFSELEVNQIIHEGTIKPFIDRVRVQCLSKRKDSIGMWTYYASQFNGFVLEYSKEDFEDAISKLGQSKSLVEYVSGLDPIEYNDNRLFPISSLTKEALTKNVFKKYSDWSHEEEYRLAFILKNPSEPFNIPIKPRRIYYGFNLELDNKEWLLIKAAEYKIQIEEMSKSEIKKLLQERAARRSIFNLAQLRLRKLRE